MRATVRSRRHFTAAAWLGLLAVLLATLAPTLSHALGTPAAAWGEVCRADTGRAAASNAPVSPQVPEPWPAAQHALEHCPFCAQPPFVLALPPARVAFAPAAARHPAPPAAAPDRAAAAALRPPTARGPPRA